MVMRAISLYRPRTAASNAASSSPCVDLAAAARYSGATPSTTSMLAVPRSRSSLAGGPIVSIVSATCGCFASAATFGAVGAVQTTTAVPFQRNPMGITRVAVGARVRETRRVGGVQELQGAGLLEILDGSCSRYVLFPPSFDGRY